MYHHLAMYSASLGAVTNSDVTTPTDGVFSTRNSHLIFSENYNLISAHGRGTLLTRARFGNIGLSYRGTNHLFPLLAGATVESRPGVIDYRAFPMKMPLNEEITIEATTSAAGPAAVWIMLRFAAPQWSMNLPSFKDRIKVRATSVVAAGTARTWGALTALTFERDLFNGTYSVIGAQVIGAGAAAFRLFFPVQRLVNGRQLRPGGLITQAIGDIPDPAQAGGLGEWGRFTTFEPPMIQSFDDTVGSTYEIRLDLAYLGESMENVWGQAG